MSTTDQKKPGSNGRVLIPSDIRNWVFHLTEGYRSLNFDVTLGVNNFDFEATTPDIVHIQWPEELVGWTPPVQKQIDEICRRLDRWASRSRIIASVHNLYPHGHRDNPLFRRLYEACYERSEVIHHFSQASKELICSEYPSLKSKNHFVRPGFNYDAILPESPRDREATRASFGIGPDEVVFLAFGALRFWDEVQLLRTAFNRARIHRKRLVLAARYSGHGSSFRERWRRWKIRQWKKHPSIVPINNYVPDEEVFRLFDAADAAVVIRSEGLSSGIPSLAMTFGRAVIAPNFGGIAEYVGTGNLLYEPGSLEQLTSMMEKASQIDLEAIGDSNRKIADGWKWKDILSGCIGSLPSPVSLS